MAVPVYCKPCGHHFRIPSLSGLGIDAVVRVLSETTCPECKASADHIMFVGSRCKACNGNGIVPFEYEAGNNSYQGTTVCRECRGSGSHP